jgi:hypothetical protein
MKGSEARIRNWFFSAVPMRSGNPACIVSFLFAGKNDVYDFFF